MAPDVRGRLSGSNTREERSAKGPQVAGRKRLRWMQIGMAAVAAGLLAIPATSAANTQENLRTAARTAMSEHARYLLCARQADREGYGAVASLFREAARSDSIEARNHLAASAGPRGVTPAAPSDMKVGTTRENLEAAIRAEAWEHDKLYPEFLHQAEKDGPAGAVRSFSLAKEASAERAYLFRQALTGLEERKGSAHRVFYVCPVCGYVADQPTFAYCPSCFTPKKQFEAVS